MAAAETASIVIRRSDERGRTRLGWLDSRHTFSFGEYRDPAWIHFRALRVINDDIVAPGMGFGTHPHADMEIISIVLSGAIAHKDSLGSGAELRPGEVQVMSAGTGIEHSEFNPSRTEPLHLLQVWILPDRRGHQPSYGQRAFPRERQIGRFVRVAGGGDTSDGALSIHQDAGVLLGIATSDTALEYPLREGRSAWVHVMRGEGEIAGAPVSAGDAVGLTRAERISARPKAGELELLLFDLA